MQLEPFKKYDEFVDYIKEHYLKTDKTVLNYKLNYEKDQSPIYLIKFYYIDMYKKSKNIFKRIFGKKVLDIDNSTYGHVLCPITEIEVLCPMIKQVDIEYIDLITKEKYKARVSVDEIYHY